MIKILSVVANENPIWTIFNLDNTVVGQFRKP